MECSNLAYRVATAPKKKNTTFSVQRCSFSSTLYPVVKMTRKGLWLSARYFRSITQHNYQIDLFSALRHFEVGPGFVQKSIISP